MTTIRAWLTPAHRRWCYAVATALLPILASIGLITDSQVGTIGALVGAILTGVATAHTPVETTASEVSEPPST